LDISLNESTIKDPIMNSTAHCPSLEMTPICKHIIKKKKYTTSTPESRRMNNLNKNVTKITTPKRVPTRDITYNRQTTMTEGALVKINKEITLHKNTHEVSTMTNGDTNEPAAKMMTKNKKRIKSYDENYSSCEEK
jgi:hypothetical protein